MALRRIPAALRRRRYCSQRQIESKVSEAGPPDMRPNPIHVSEALKELSGEGKVFFESHGPADVNLPMFFTLPEFSLTNPADAARRDEVLRLYVTFLRAGIEDQGKTLERSVFTAALQARRQGQYTAVVGSPDRPPDQALVFNGVRLEKALDLILVGRDGTPVAIEEKNLREWLGPAGREVWALIGKALHIDGLPVLICRKVTYDMFFFFKRIGALAFPMHTQLFPLEFSERLAEVKHKDGLGFADIRFGDQPPDRLVRFLNDTLPRILPERIAAFRRHAGLLAEYTFEGLEEDLPGDARRAMYNEFFEKLKEGE